jgi:hypothetical protein
MTATQAIAKLTDRGYMVRRQDRGFADFYLVVPNHRRNAKTLTTDCLISLAAGYVTWQGLNQA